MSFREELAALVAEHLQGIPEGKGLKNARYAVEDALRAEADRQALLQDVEQLNADGFEFFQLETDVLNPKPDGRKASAFRRQQLWDQGAVFVGRGEEIGRISPRDHGAKNVVWIDGVPANIAEEIYQNSRKLTMAEAIEQHDRQKAVFQAAHDEFCRKLEEKAEAEEKEERERQEALDILERMKKE
jgi:hypothetical protein